MKKIYSFVTGAAAFFASAISSSAQSMTLIDSNPSQSVSGKFTIDGAYQNYTSGVLNFSVGGGGPNIRAFCIEPLATINYGQTVKYSSTSLTSPATENVARLIGGYLASAQSPLDAAGAQWAIWEVLFDDPTSFDAGNVQLNPTEMAVKNHAQSFLTNLSSYDSAEISFLTAAGAQDMVTFPNGTSNVPEPHSLGLLAFSALVLFRRKRN